MGMYAMLVTIDDRHIDRVLADPPLIWNVISPDDPTPYQEARRAKEPGFLARLFGAKAKEAAPVPPLSLGKGEGVETSLDKAWHGIHYLLTGTAWEGDPPLNFLVLGGAELQDVDAGDNPPRLYRAAEVSAILDALRKLTDEELSRRFDPSDMMEQEIYPDIWDRDPKEDDAQAYVMEYLRTLRAFLEQTVGTGMGLVVQVG